MEVVELSDQGAPKWYCKKRGESGGGKTKPVVESDRFTFASS